MNKKIIWGIVALAIITVIGMVAFQQLSTSNEPLNLKNVVNKIHEEVTPGAHKTGTN